MNISDNKKTLLFVASGLGYGGAEKSLCFVASSLSRFGYNVHIANLKTTDDTVLQPLPNDISVHDASSIKGRGLRRFDQLKKVKKIAKKIGADVIIGFTFFPNAFASMAARKLKIKSIMSERGNPYKTIGNGFVSHRLLSAIERCDGGVFQTEGAMEFYSQGLRSRGTVIPNPIFLPTYEIPERDIKSINKTVVYVGRLENTQKRIDVLLKAFKLFWKVHPEYTLRIFGDGSYENEARSLCAELGIEKQVLLMGKTSQPMRDIVCDGIYAITSDYEGISNSLLEAMAVGLPCVSTDHTPGGARLLIDDGINGLLAPMGDTQKIADAMARFADNPSLASSCGEKAREVKERFAPEKIIKMWIEYINSIIK